MAGFLAAFSAFGAASFVSVVAVTGLVATISMLLSTGIGFGDDLGAAFGLAGFSAFVSFAATDSAANTGGLAGANSFIAVSTLTGSVLAASFGTKVVFAFCSRFGSRFASRFKSLSRFLLRLRPPRRLRPDRSGRAVVSVVTPSTGAAMAAVVSTFWLSVDCLSGRGVRSGLGCCGRACCAC